MSVLVRPLERADRPRVVQMLRALNQAGIEADPRYQLQPDADAMLAGIVDDWLTVFSPFPVALVAEVDGRVVGYVQGGADRIHPILASPPGVTIGNQWVDPEYRRRGIGRELVLRWVDAAKKAGFERISVGTLARDERAVSFWRALGFTDFRLTLTLAQAYSGTSYTPSSLSIRHGSSSSTSSVKK